MIQRPDRTHYSRNFKIALVSSLSIVILVFIFFPNNLFKKKNIEISDNLIFTSADIPPTMQSSVYEQTADKIPPTPSIFIPSEIDESEILKDVEITGNNANTSQQGLAGKDIGIKNGIETSMPFVPRQILEVMPKKVDKTVEGYIKLSLKIGIDGKVETYIVLANTTNCSECLQNVLLAVHKSKWQPATVDGKKIEYWIEKSYNFN